MHERDLKRCFICHQIVTNPSFIRNRPVLVSPANTNSTPTMNHKSATWTKLAASIFFCGLAASAHAQTADALLNKLVSKGILTPDEAKALSKETTTVTTTTTTTVKAEPNRWSLAGWLQNIKLSGDFRGRYDGIFENGNNYAPTSPTDPTNVNADQDRNRFRYRLRLGLTTTLTDHFEVGLRLASGDIGTVAAAGPGGGANVNAASPNGGSPFSANTTLNNDASRKFIFVDLAYAKWTPAKYFQAEIGKMNNAFWYTDMVFDPDYNPEGGQEKFNFDINDKQRVSFTSGQYVIQENFAGTGNGNNNDVYLFVNQLDWTGKWLPQLTTRFGGSIYNFKNQRDISAALETFINQNGTSAAGPGAPNFNPIIGRGEITWTLDSFPAFKGGFPITAGGEYANNPGAGSHVNEAYNLGVILGSAKDKGNWQIAYNYKNIETAAVWHGLNDDDFGFNARGGTAVRGHQVIASYHPVNPLTVNVRYMRTEQIDNPPGTQAKQDRLFFDLVWAF